MHRRLTALGVLGHDGEPAPGPDNVARLYAAYAKAGGERRPCHYSKTRAGTTARAAGARLRPWGCRPGGSRCATRGYLRARARCAVRNCGRRHHQRRGPRRVRVRTVQRVATTILRIRRQASACATMTPAPSGRCIEPVTACAACGLGWAECRCHQRALAVAAARLLRALSRNYHVGDTDVVVQNGRVRAGYEIGGLVGAAIVVHVIGERPGTGINTLSAYLTYGRDEHGLPRWSRALDHAATTAVCGIHPKGKPPEAACVESRALSDESPSSADQALR